MAEFSSQAILGAEHRVLYAFVSEDKKILQQRLKACCIPRSSRTSVTG